MSATLPTNNDRVARPPAAVPDPRDFPRHAATDHLALARAFAVTIPRYLLRILPQVSSELAHWRTRALEIPDPHLRDSAIQALAKRGNIEGAALFATLVPASQRRRAVRALVTFQTAYNYLDTLSELPSDDPVANGDQLHQALLVGLCPGVAHLDYYRHSRHRGDGAYLSGVIDAFGDAVAGLPSYTTIAPAARTAAMRIIDFQSRNLSDGQGGHDALARWATEMSPVGNALTWWELAGAAGSSLAVHALIAAAADSRLQPWQARQIDGAYFPWIGALHTMLDSLVDRAEDHESGQRSLLDYYQSPTDAAIQVAGLAIRALSATERLPSPYTHRVIVMAMCSYYLSAPEAHPAQRQTITRAVGLPLSGAIATFRARRLAAAFSHKAYT